jgi:hypothetical protein
LQPMIPAHDSNAFDDLSSTYAATGIPLSRLILLVHKLKRLTVGGSIPSLALRNRVLIGLLIPRKHIARAEMEIGNKTDPQPNPQFGMSYMSSGYFGSPRGLVSCCKTYSRCPCHGRGREFESRRPRQLFQGLREQSPQKSNPQYSDESAARVAVAGLTLELNPGARPTHSGFMTILLDCADKLVRGVAHAPNRAIASGTHRLRPPTKG